MLTGWWVGIAFAGLGVALAAAPAWPRVWLAACLGTAGAALSAALTVLGSGVAWTWQCPVPLGGELLRLHLDGVSAVFLVLLAAVAGAGALYATEYMAERAHPSAARSGRFWWAAMWFGMCAVLLSANGLHFLIGWEVFAVSGYFLVTLHRANAAARAAGWLYLAASHIATLILFAFFALLAARTGGWALGPVLDQPRIAPLFWLMLTAFGIKAGVFFLHVWLPSAHANAPSHVSALLSGVAIKMGVYGFVRFSGWLPLPPMAGWTVAALGVMSAVLGVVFALGQHDLKRLLAYHSVENIGIILIGVGFALVAAESGHAVWGRVVLAGGLLHVWNHGLFKSLLFLGAGSVLHATGTRVMSRLGGLWRAMPWTAGLFALGAAAIAGLPPLNGFVSEWLIYKGLFRVAQLRDLEAMAAALAVVLLAMTGALALACFVKVCGIVFLGAPRSPAAVRAHECGLRMRGPMMLLAAACAAIGFMPVAFWPLLSAAIDAWRPGWGAGPAPVGLAALGWCHGAVALAAMIGGWALWRWTEPARARRGATWDCGYTAATARMQYTAASFASIITGWFAWILCPARHVVGDADPLPRHMALSEHTPETVLEKIILPVAGAIQRAADRARRIQHGVVHSYLVYLLGGLAVVLFLAMGGDQPTP